MEFKIYFYFVLVVATTSGKYSFVSWSTSAEAANAAMFASLGDHVSNLTAGGADRVADLGASYDEFVMESEISHAVLLTIGNFKQVTKGAAVASTPAVLCGKLGYRPCLPKPNAGHKKLCTSPYDRPC